MRGDDRGSGTVLVLCVAALLAATGAVLAVLGAAAVARHRAASAADLAALAAADRAPEGEPAACAAAAGTARAVGAEVVSCGLEGDVATVVVAVRAGGALRGLGPARATARAGPGRALPGRERSSPASHVAARPVTAARRG